MLKKEIKLIFFDMEGTIFKKAVSLKETNVAPSAWVAIAKSLGEKVYKEELKTQERYNNGGYSNYIEWMEDTIRIHKEFRLKKNIFCNTLDKIEYTRGAKEVFSTINTKRIPTCLISGGFKYQADKAVKKFRIKHSFASCEYFWDKNGFLQHWNLLPGDFKGKLNFMRLLIREYGYSRKECAFIGDGDNDVPLAKYVGISIAFNGSDKLRKVATYSIIQNVGKEDLREVLRYLKI